MFEGLVNLDKELLLFFNHLNNPFLDFIFYWISDKWIWIPFYGYLLWLVYKQEKSNSIFVLIFIAAAITISDQISSAVIKEHVMRLRPCNDPSISGDIHLVNGYCGGKYGFISSHASNVFTLAAFLTGIFDGNRSTIKKIIFVWAAIVSFSRIYLGAHYPGDVIGGVVLGLLVGSLAGYYYQVVKKKYFKKELTIN